MIQDVSSAVAFVSIDVLLSWTQGDDPRHKCSRRGPFKHAHLWVRVDLAFTDPLLGRGVFSCVRIWQEVGIGRRSRPRVKSKRRFSTVCTMKQMVSWLPGAKVAFRSPTF